jgi:hypothetical protein
VQECNLLSIPILHPIFLCIFACFFCQTSWEKVCRSYHSKCAKTFIKLPNFLFFSILIFKVIKQYTPSTKKAHSNSSNNNSSHSANSTNSIKQSAQNYQYSIYIPAATTATNLLPINSRPSGPIKLHTTQLTIKNDDFSVTSKQADNVSSQQETIEANSTLLNMSTMPTQTTTTTTIEHHSIILADGKHANSTTSMHAYKRNNNNNAAVDRRLTSAQCHQQAHQKNQQPVNYPHGMVQIDEDLTSLSWLQNLNIMKPVAASAAASNGQIGKNNGLTYGTGHNNAYHQKIADLLPHQHHMMKTDNDELELDSATVPAVNNRGGMNKASCGSVGSSRKYNKSSSLMEYRRQQSLNSCSEQTCSSSASSSPQSNYYYQHQYPSPPNSCASPNRKSSSIANSGAPTNSTRSPNVAKKPANNAIGRHDSMHQQHQQYSGNQNKKSSNKLASQQQSQADQPDDDNNEDDDDDEDNNNNKFFDFPTIKTVQFEHNEQFNSYRYDATTKPPYSYSQLIIMAMRESKCPKMTLQMIYDWIIENFIYFKKADTSWQITFKNSIRHNLSLNKCFRKIPRQKNEPGKGGFWMLDPDYERQLDKSFNNMTNTFNYNQINQNKRRRNNNNSNSSATTTAAKQRNQDENIDGDGCLPQEPRPRKLTKDRQKTIKQQQQKQYAGFTNADDDDDNCHDECNNNDRTDTAQQNNGTSNEYNVNRSDSNPLPKKFKQQQLQQPHSFNNAKTKNNKQQQNDCDKIQQLQPHHHQNLFNMHPIDLDSSGENGHHFVLRSDTNWACAANTNP